MNGRWIRMTDAVHRLVKDDGMEIVAEKQVDGRWTARARRWFPQVTMYTTRTRSYASRAVAAKHALADLLAREAQPLNPAKPRADPAPAPYTYAAGWNAAKAEDARVIEKLAQDLLALAKTIADGTLEGP